MPTGCCVPKCTNQDGGFSFPKDHRRNEWIAKVHRLTKVGSKTISWQPTHNDVVCYKHFRPEEIIKKKKKRTLVKGAVPSIFEFGLTVKKPRKKPATRTTPLPPVQPAQPEDVQIESMDIGAEVELVENIPGDGGSFDDGGDMEVQSSISVGVQCQLLTQNSYFDLAKYMHDDEAIRYYTGFASYAHLKLLYCFLEPSAKTMHRTQSIVTRENQLFLTLIKLRLNRTDKGLAYDFGICRATASRIINIWINLIYLELKEINTWLDKEVIDEYFPTKFKKLFPTTRVILDATEIPIQKPSSVTSQRASFSSYKNTNTIKVMVGIAPRGQVTYLSDCYGGSTSDRQIIERCTLISKNMLEKGDSILADRGIMVQDLFASRDVYVNTPTTMKGRNQLPSDIVLKDRRIASKRIHVERVIGYAKTFKILKQPLSSDRLSLGGRIVSVCLFLTNFRECIVGKNA